jgi:methionine-S-sulfoxide reductase
LATFGGGHIRGVELAFQQLQGVEFTALGYTQGEESFPTYEKVFVGATGHTEAVIVYYNPKMVSYEKLVRLFLNQSNPTTANYHGKQYRMGIYFHTPEQENIARSMLLEEESKYSKPIATELRQARPFWPADLYHSFGGCPFSSQQLHC